MPCAAAERDCKTKKTDRLIHVPRKYWSRKTELIKLIKKTFYDENMITRIDMSEYQERHIQSLV